MEKYWKIIENSQTENALPLGAVSQSFYYQWVGHLSARMTELWIDV